MGWGIPRCERGLDAEVGWELQGGRARLPGCTFLPRAGRPPDSQPPWVLAERRSGVHLCTPAGPAVPAAQSGQSLEHGGPSTCWGALGGVAWVWLGPGAWWGMAVYDDRVWLYRVGDDFIWQEHIRTYWGGGFGGWAWFGMVGVVWMCWGVASASGRVITHGAWPKQMGVALLTWYSCTCWGVALHGGDF